MDHMDEDMKSIRDELLSYMMQLLDVGTEQDDGRKLHIAGALGVFAGAIQEGQIQEFADAVTTWGRTNLMAWKMPKDLPH